MKNEITDNYKTLSEIFNEVVNIRGLNIERLSELTGVPKRYLFALRDGDFKNLPSAPYVRGYLLKIADVLDIDGNFLWQTYKKENLFRTSGIEDKLPSNRFAIKPLNKKRMIVVLVVILVLTLLAWKINDFVGTPRLEIVSPARDNLIINSPSIKLSGKASPQDKLNINGEESPVSSDGFFEKEFTLQPGINTVEFKIKRLLGKEIKIMRQVIYQP